VNTVSFTALFLLAAVIFQDDFNDGNADGWYTVGPSNYQVQNERYHFSGGGAVNDATSYRGDTGEMMSTPDYSMCTDVEIDVGIFGGIMTRYSENGLYNMMLVLSVPHQALRLYRWHWSSIELIESYSFPVQAGTTYTIRGTRPYICHGVLWFNRESTLLGIEKTADSIVMPAYFFNMYKHTVMQNLNGIPGITISSRFPAGIVLTDLPYAGEWTPAEQSQFYSIRLQSAGDSLLVELDTNNTEPVFIRRVVLTRNADQ